MHLRRALPLFVVLELAVACGGAMREIDEVNKPGDDAALARCRHDGRAAKDAGASPLGAYGAYVECTREAGLR